MTISVGFASYLFEAAMFLSVYVSTFTHTRMYVIVTRCSSQEALVMTTIFLVC